MKWRRSSLQAVEKETYSKCERLEVCTDETEAVEMA